MRSIMDDLFNDSPTFLDRKHIKDDNALIITRTQYHLERLFNSRKNSIAHMPDYGLSDFFLVFQNLPYSLQHLTLEIKNLISKYEKNITEFSLHSSDLKDVNVVLAFTLFCKINHVFEASFHIKFCQNRFVAVTHVTNFCSFTS